MSEMPPRGPLDPRDDDPLILPPDETRIQPPYVAPGDDVDVNVVRERERTRVLADGSVVRDTDRVETSSGFRDYLPWVLIAVLGILLIGGLGLWYFTRSSDKTVPAVVGLRIDEAVTRLQDDGFKTTTKRQSNPRRPGIVFGQNPASGDKRSKGSSVALLVSRGPSRATVPNAVGETQAQARASLVKAGFVVVSAEIFSDQPNGTVTAQDPSAGTSVAPGSKVHLNISKGSATVDVPSEIGQTVDQAQSDLASKGFKTTVTHVPSDQPLDTVVAQSPTGGQAKKGSNVQLNVSQGPTTTTTTDTTTVPATTPTDTTTVTTPTDTTGTDTTTTP
jgi:beta-lactam-binding protein with PASTA domain